MLYDDLAEQFKRQGHSDKVVEYLEQAIQLRQPVESTGETIGNLHS